MHGMLNTKLTFYTQLNGTASQTSSQSEELASGDSHQD